MTMEVYLDNNATTRPLPKVRAAVLSALGEEFGNPSSVHEAGERGRTHLRTARRQLGDLVGCEPEQLLFTSGGTEANAQVLLSAIAGQSNPRIVTTTVEHSSIRHLCEHLRTRTVEVVLLPVDECGLVDLDQFDDAISTRTDLVSLQWVNNETGVIQLVEHASVLCRDKGIPFHTDAAQAIGKLPMHISAQSIDFLTLTAHKLHGPQGVGAVYARNPRTLRPLLFSGDQEFGLRGGTENVPGIVGFGQAAELRRSHLAAIIDRLSHLRNQFETRVREEIPDVSINGDGTERVCNTSNVLFEGVDGQALVARLDQDGIRCSQSSACTNQRPEPSYVLRAMGLSEADAYASVRFGFSVENTREQVEFVVERLAQHCEQLRGFQQRLVAATQPSREVT